MWSATVLVCPCHFHVLRHSRLSFRHSRFRGNDRGEGITGCGNDCETEMTVMFNRTQKDYSSGSVSSQL